MTDLPKIAEINIHEYLSLSVRVVSGHLRRYLMEAAILGCSQTALANILYV